MILGMISTHKISTPYIFLLAGGARCWFVVRWSWATTYRRHWCAARKINVLCRVLRYWL